ncbi:DUF6221 family protein [Cellulosimicrobium cellulans]|uniref:DUF6221 family protein n=1 Tax=Cellulosimicrobium cellulans TaxID=1710 RepID=UPI0035D5E41F
MTGAQDGAIGPLTRAALEDPTDTHDALVEFVVARIAEDRAVLAEPLHEPPGAWNLPYEEQEAADDRRHGQPHSRNCGWRLGEGMDDACSCHVPARLSSQLDGFDRIVQNHARHMPGQRGYGASRYAVQCIARTWFDHAEFDETWLQP